MTHELPVVIAIAGLDPSGGAGIQADIQTLTALQCHCTPIITTNTVQDSRQLYRSESVAAEVIDHQLRALQADFNISAIKLGALGSIDNIAVIAGFIRRITAQTPSIPVILDPVLNASKGGRLSDESLQRSLLRDIIPLCTLITPNEPELNTLLNSEHDQSDPITPANLGASVLLTGGHNRYSDTNILENKLIVNAHSSDNPKSWIIERVDGEFRGTGCTFASAIAGYMAKGLSVTQAIENAQIFVSYALENAYNLRSGQRVPLRIPPPVH